MKSKNTTASSPAQYPVTVTTGFCDTPIDNKGTQMLQVVAGIDSQDALQTAKVLASGLGQICNHLHDSLNIGELAYCDGAKTLAFIAETVSALVWSVQRGTALSTEVEANQ